MSVAGAGYDCSFCIDDYQFRIGTYAVGSKCVSGVGIWVEHQLRPCQPALLYFLPPSLHTETEGQGDELHSAGMVSLVKRLHGRMDFRTITAKAMPEMEHYISLADIFA